jgi:hypothetical protein
MTLQRGDIVPHFDVRTISGDRFSYSAIWQRKILVLISLSPTAAEDEAYVRELKRHEAEFSERDSVCVVTRDGISGLPSRGALIADQWGEIVYVATAIDVDHMLTPRRVGRVRCESLSGVRGRSQVRSHAASWCGRPPRTPRSAAFSCCR